MNTVREINHKRTSSTRSLETSPGKDCPERDSASERETSGSQQTISCSRCGGLMRPQWCFNVNYDAGEMEILTWRCLQCGEMIDPVILANRQNPAPPVTKQRSRQVPTAAHKSQKRKAKEN